MKPNLSYLSVFEVTKEIKNLIEKNPQLSQIMMHGEISNFKHHSRGHMYFTLKDDRARISAVMFAGNNRALRFRPENGMKVLVQGNVSVYEPYGQYQLYVRMMEPDGLGQLYLAYEQLKQKLDSEGLFSADRKKPLPRFPANIGVITSRTGAVIRDIYTTIKRRYPNGQITLYPVAVQGPNAVPSIVSALKAADQGGMDVIIAGRGGGSIEELWAFNDEQVVRTSAALHTPIISAVGHETDVTLHDFVADVRAATPTAAAELAVPSMKEWLDKVNTNRSRLQQATNQLIRQQNQRLQRLDQSYAFKYPEQLIKQKEQELDRNLEQLHKNITRLVNERAQRYAEIERRFVRINPAVLYEKKKEVLKAADERLERAMKDQYTKVASKYEQLVTKLSILNPLETLRRGYSVTYRDHQLVTSANEYRVDDQITIYFQDGHIEGKVENVSDRTFEMLRGDDVRDK